MSAAVARVVNLVESRIAERLEEIILRAESRARETGVAYRGLLTPDEAWRVFQELPGATLIDIRTSEELTLIGKVPGAIEIPWRLFRDWDLNPRFLRDIKNRFLPTDTILLLCRSGIRSREAAELLAAEGFRNSFNVLEGFEGDKNEAGQRIVAGWKVRGLPWSQ